MVTAMISRMMPLATPSAPGEKCSSLVSRPPRTSSSTATVAAVVSILRRTRRFVTSGISLVASRNGTSAIFGPTPIRSSKNVSMTKVAFSDSRSITASSATRSDPVGLRRQPHSPQYIGVQPGQSIGGCKFVAVGVSRGVVGHPDHVLDGRFAVDHGLAGAGDLRGDLADGVDAQEYSGASVEDQFEQAFLAGDEPAWCGAQLAAPRLIGDALGGTVFLALAHASHFGQPVDRRCRDLVDVGGEVEAERSAQGLASLVGGDRGEGRADDVAGGEDPRAAGPPLGVDDDPAAGIGLDPGGVEAETRGADAAAGGEQQRVGAQLSAVVQPDC